VPRLIRILLVEGSPDELRRLGDVLRAAADMAVVGEAATAAVAQRLAGALSPDAIVIGGFPGQGSVELVASIMETAAAPIIAVVSSPAATDESSRALKAGAVAVVPLPMRDGDERQQMEARFVSTVRAMAEVRVVSRRPGGGRVKVAAPPPVARAAGAFDVIAIGASAGGPQAIFTILSGLPADFPAPLLIVQHMTVGFLGSLLDWLNCAGGPPMHVPASGEPLAAGIAYLAPDERHLGVDRRGRVELSTSPPERGLRPAVSYLFRSVRQAYGARCVGVLLSGMGRDGADELKLMRDAGGATIAQDEGSCVVYGMPREAVVIGGATYELAIEKVAPTLLALTGRGTAGRRGGEQRE